MTIRFRTRTFLFCFVPFALLLTAGFWMIQRYVESIVCDGLRTSLRGTQMAIARLHAKNDLESSRFLKVVGENAALKGGMQLLIAAPGNDGARRTVEDQLRELGEHMGFDFLLVSSPSGVPMAGVVRGPGQANGQPGELVPLDLSHFSPVKQGLLLVNGRAVQVASLAMDQNDENLGSLSVGADFEFSEFTTPVVLTHNGHVIDSNLPDLSFDAMTAALAQCKSGAECDFRMQGANWISLPMPSDAVGSSYALRSLQNADAAIAPVQTVLHELFVTVGLGSLLVALLCSLASSRSIVRPLAAVVEHLRNTADGVLPEVGDQSASTVEIRELLDSYSRAAVSVREAREDLQDAYVEFVGSLASALDARDQYTAGHSKRVSELSSATAAAMGLNPDHVERVRIGALLHDIGKIGVADSVLQKPGKLTEEEFALVKQHPVIGRRILEGVQGLSPYLAAVELHHENWDGTGYPKGQSGEETEVDARIVHVADAYDAMTTNRSYRSYRDSSGVRRNAVRSNHRRRVYAVAAGSRYGQARVAGTECSCGRDGGNHMRLTLASSVLLLGLSVSTASYAQEATSGVDVRETISSQAAGSTEFTEPGVDRSPLQPGFRSVTYPTVKLSDNWTVSGAYQLYSHPYFFSSFTTPGYGVKGNLLQGTLNYARVSEKGSILARAGIMSSAFGSFLLRYDDAENALVDLPPAYGYYYAPVSIMGLAAVQLDATRGKWDGRVQFANSSPLNPRSLFAADEYGNWAGGGGYTIRQGLRIGVSGYRGPYLDRHYKYFFPGEANPNTLPAHALGADAQWAHGHWNLQGEFQRFLMPYAHIPVFYEDAGYVEVKRALNARWYVAGRGGYYSTSRAGNTAVMELACGWRPGRFELLKIDYELTHYTSGSPANDNTVAVQFVATLHASHAFSSR
ncbi:MAG: HD-GYP domain-containing protein [Acidobacteriota bacterium]